MPALGLPPSVGGNSKKPETLTIMNKFLRLKHWQIFIILTCMMIVSIFVAESGLKIGNFDSIQLSIMVRVIGVIILFLWYLILGLSLNKVIDNPYKFKSGLFIIAIIFCAFGYSNMNLQAIFSENYIVPNFVSMLSTPLTLLGLIYVFYNLPISLKSLEINRKAGFSDCVLDMILLFVFPVGIWIIQPRLNKVFMTKKS